MKVIKTDNPEVDIFLTKCSGGGTEPNSVAVGLQKVTTGDMHILFYITDKNVNDFLLEMAAKKIMKKYAKATKNLAER